MTKSRLGLLSGYLRRKRLTVALPLLDGRVLDLGFDTAVALAVIEHVPDPSRKSVSDWISPA
jgi:hypothetical protein